MRAIAKVVFFWVLGVTSTWAVTVDPDLNKYKIYQADLNGDNKPDYYFQGISLFIPIHGDIVIPLVLPAPASFTVYSHGNIFLTPFAETYTDAQIAAKNLQLTSATFATLQTVIANATVDPNDPNGTGTVQTPTQPQIASTPVAVGSIDATRALPAEFDVTNSGQATYKIPVVTAPGSAGLVPNVSLNYSSGGGNGIAGLGWSLSAYGAISRCRQTEGVDGVAKPITWTSEDRFCLNGDRLLLASGTYGAAGSTYKTEIDSFLRVTAMGGISGHPDYFTVEYKDGIIESYGNTSDSYNSKNQLSASNSSTVLDWTLSKRSDSAGNKIVYNYVKDADGQRIDTIDYAFGATSTRGAYLQFNYESRNDPISGYVAGHSYKTGTRVSNIKSYNGTTEIRTYALTYNQGTAYTTNDKLSRINKVQECVGSTCSPATEFEWETSSNSLGAYSTAIDFGVDGFNNFKTGDINGDGLLDIAWETRVNFQQECDVSWPIGVDASPPSGSCWTGSAVTAPTYLKYALASRDTTGRITYTTKLKLLYKSNVGYGELARSYELLDYNNDGRSDLVFIGNSEQYLRIYLSTPNADGNWYLSATPIIGNAASAGNHNSFADVNGDGAVDFISVAESFNPYFGEPTYSNVQLSTKSGSQNNNLYNHGETIYISQILADGTEAVYPGTTTYSVFSYIDDFSTAPIARPRQVAGDFNGDGQSDLIADTFAVINCRDYSQPSWDYYPCESSFFTGLYTLQYQSENANKKIIAKFFHAVPRGRVTPVDINADGLTDILIKQGSQWLYQINTGSGFQAEINLNVTNNGSAQEIIFEDYNKDGFSDVLWVDKGSLLTTNTKTDRSGMGELKVKYWNPQNNAFDNAVKIRDEYVEFKGAITIHGKTHYDYSVFNYSLIDLDQNGTPDFIRSTATQDGKFEIAKNTSAINVPNKIIGVKNGLDQERKIKYGRVNDNTNYSRIDGISTITADETQCETIVETHGNNPIDQEVCWTVPGTVDSTQFYNLVANPWVELRPEEQSLSPASPVMEAFGAMPIVTSVETTAPEASDQSPLLINNSAKLKLSYYYSQAKMQAGGRGFLGFKTFGVLNHATGVRTETEYRQDWPFIGQVRKKKTFTGNGHRLNEQVNTWGFVNCHDTLGNPSATCVTSMSTQVDASGTGALGSVKPFLRKSITETRALTENDLTEGPVISNSTETNLYDTKGNVLESSSVVTSDLPVKGVNKKTVNTYDYSGSTWSMQQGRLQRLAVTANDSVYGAVTRTSSFTYYPSGADIGLLQTETIEPDNSLFTVTTTHSYSLGNRTKSVTTANSQTRQSEVAYDSRGRYVNYTSGFFTNGSNPDTPVQRTVSQIVSRDKYGTPTESRHFISASAYVTKKTATTAFGTPYFTADSTGAAVEIKIGAGTDTYGVCPSDTKVWSTSQAAGGGTSIQCSDILGRTRRAGSIGFDGTNWSLVDTEYDKLGRILRTSAPYWRNSSERYWTSHSYDLLGRAIETHSPYKSSYVTSTTKYTNLDVEIKNPKGQIRTEKRDLAGQVIEVVDPNNGITKFAYDARGNMREMRDPALNTTIVGYDLRDRKTSMSDPDKGNWIYKYNSFGDLVCQMDGKGQTSVQRYDIAGRVFSRTDRNAGGNCDNATGAVDKYTQWTYDIAANGLGQLASVSDSASVGGSAQYQQSFIYDGFGRASSTTTTMPGHLGTIGSHYEKITYDQYGRVFQSFDAARTSASFITNGVQNIYNAQGYLHKAVDAVSYSGTQQAYYTVKTMNARGNVTSAEYGNGVTQAADYYPETGLTKKLRADRALVSLPLQDITLDWDELGNLDWREERGIASDSVRRNIREDFDYDSLNRLKTWVSSGDLAANETANYNSIDNITDKTGIGNYLYGNQCGTGTNAGPHALCRAGTTNYNYDKNGNMLNDSAGRIMKYTSYDLPSEISKSSHKTEFSYGPSRARYKRIDTSPTSQVTTTLYLGSVEKVYYPDGSIQWKRNIAGVGLITQTVNSSGVKLGEAQRYLIKDHLGSLSLITDEIGAVEQSNYFDPWGRERKIVTSGAIKQWLADNANFRIASKPITTRGFTGHEQLAEVGLIHMNGRIYDGALGRFVQADPIIQDPMRVQSLNRYSYVWNNPLNATDPSGFLTVSECGANCVSFSGDYLGEDVMGAAFSDGRFTIKGKEISPFVPTKTGTAAYSMNATSDGESSNGKLWDEFVRTSKNSMPKESSEAHAETTGTAVPESSAPKPNSSDELTGEETREYAQKIHQKGKETASTLQAIVELINPADPTSKTKIVKVGEKIVEAAKKEEKVADSLNVASGVITRGGGRNLPFADKDRLTEINKTLDRIDSNGPFPHKRDGIAFKNREGKLPEGNYKEYTVDTPGASNRGTRRIVRDQDTGNTYYTDDHYENFIQIDPEKY